jgi:hypothetical protein
LKWKRTYQEKPQKDDNRVAVELWRAKVPLSTVRNQLKVCERTLRRVLAFEKANTLNYIKSEILFQGGGGKSTCPQGFRKSLFRRGEYPDTRTVWPLYISTNNRHY